MFVNIALLYAILYIISVQFLPQFVLIYTFISQSNFPHPPAVLQAIFYIAVTCDKLCLILYYINY